MQVDELNLVKNICYFIMIYLCMFSLQLIDKFQDRTSSILSMYYTQNL